MEKEEIIKKIYYTLDNVQNLSNEEIKKNYKEISDFIGTLPENKRGAFSWEHCVESLAIIVNGIFYEDKCTEILEKMRKAINEKNLEDLTAHVDVEKFFNEGYDEVIDELAINCEKFHKMYPHDLLFKFGSTALRFYNEKFRGIHLGFVKRTMNAYFDKNLVPPKSFTAHPIDFCGVELGKLLKALHCEIKNISVETGRVIADVNISGDNSSYGKMWGSLDFKFEFVMEGENLKLNKILNVRELVAPVLDMAETYWPSEWDLGIKF